MLETVCKICDAATAEILELFSNIFDYSEIKYTSKTVNPFCRYIPEYRDSWLSDLYNTKNISENLPFWQIEFIQKILQTK